MKKRLLLYFVFGILGPVVSGQVVLEVADNTLKVSGHNEVNFYYGFEQGDELVFSFEEINGHELKEVEITELPSSCKFMDYKIKKIEKKIIHVTNTGIFKFRLLNTAITSRTCKIKIQRIPAGNAPKNFNPSVYWRTVQDTIYTQAPKRYLAKCDTLVATVVDQVSKINASSLLNRQADKEVVEFTLPCGTISWSYYIGVGTEGQKAFNKTKASFLNTAAAVATRIPGYGTMAALALYGINTFQMIQGEDNVRYSFIPNAKSMLQFKSGNQFNLYQQGNVLNVASQMKAPLSGKVYLGLQNDNLLESIEVKVNVTAVVVNQHWATRIAQIGKITERQEAYLK